MSIENTRMLLTEKTLNIILRNRIEDRIKFLQEGFKKYNGQNPDGSVRYHQFSPSYSRDGHTF